MAGGSEVLAESMASEIPQASGQAQASIVRISRVSSGYPYKTLSFLLCRNGISFSTRSFEASVPRICVAQHLTDSEETPTTPSNKNINA